MAAPCALVLAAGCGRGRAPESARINPEVLTNVLWDDGRAEVSSYSGSTAQGGESRGTSASLIVVKEDLLRATLVKSDAGPIPGQTVTAIKCNFISDFRMGTYDEHQMATVMFERSSFGVLKETASHTDGCGITFVRLGPVKGALTQEAHSYWQGEADRITKIDAAPGELVYEDGLPVWLRGWAGERRMPAVLEVRMLPSQLGARAPIAATRPVRAMIRRRPGGALDTPAGRFETVEFTIECASGQSRYWFDTRFPHVLVRFEGAGGRWLELRSTVRLDYWNHTRNGDDRLLGAPSPAP